eukprot:GCRY01001933.1.p1 GENE.GCRY01001933.1~~GCRY01001933.1.p1  ORF type:complete len:401 (-),score=95.70 GCRY01001933.1:474-1553(-)
MNPTLWLVASPKEVDFNKISKQTEDHATTHRLAIPDLRVGTLDTLMTLSDDLVKVDNYVESTVRRFARQLNELYASEGKTNEQLAILGAPLDNVVVNFKWDDAKYPINESLQKLVDVIHKRVSMVDDELKIKVQDYAVLKGSVTAMERKEEGNLTVKSLSGIVKEEGVIDTENLISLFVAVPNLMLKEWNANYEKLASYVVPRSAVQIASDKEFTLFSVTLFKRCADEFKNKARDQRFIVRDYLAEKKSNQTVDQMKTMKKELLRKQNALLRWLQAQFGELYFSWIHIKAILLFTEGVLQYGLPASYNFFVLMPRKKAEAKLRAALFNIFRPANADLYAKEDTEFVPYVFSSMNIDFNH